MVHCHNGEIKRFEIDDTISHCSKDLPWTKKQAIKKVARKLNAFLRHQGIESRFEYEAHYRKDTWTILAKHSKDTIKPCVIRCGRAPFDAVLQSTSQYTRGV